jgi:hypothetical protein
MAAIRSVLEYGDRRPQNRLERDPCAGAPPLIVRLVPNPGAAGYETVVRAPSSRQEMRLKGEELLRTPGTFGDPFRAVESCRA